MTIQVTLDNQIQAWLSSQNKTGVNTIDYMIVNHSDGKGPQIGFWNATTLGPQPTSTNFASVATQADVLATEQLLASGEIAIQTWLDQTAQQFGYDSLISACSYKGSTNTTWNAQATAFASWRDAVWTAAAALRTNIQAGTSQPPASASALIASLPQPNIPAS